MENMITIETGATGVFALSACVGSAVSGLRKRPATGLVGLALRSVASVDASTRNRTDVPTPVPVRPGGAYG